MNGVPMRFDYRKTINEQLPTFNYYKDRYTSYELQILNLIKEKELFKNTTKEIKELILKQIDISNKEIEKIRYTNPYHFNFGYQQLMIGQEQDIIKILEKLLQILDKVKIEGEK